MAKKLTEEDLILNVIVNGNQSKREMGELSRFIKDASKEVSKLEAQERKLADAGKKNTAEYKQLTMAIRQKTDAIEQARTKMIRLVQTMDVTKMSTTELKASVISLKKAMENSVPGSERWNIYKNQLDAVKSRIAEVKVESEKTGSALSRMATGFNKFIGIITAGVASFVAAISGIRSAVNTYAQLDDVMGGVQKTTGLAKDEVKALNDELKKIDSRTSQEDLLGLGRIGGKLGVGDPKELEGFIRATDQIVVALNEDLGGDVEETVNQVGKLVDIFKIKGEFGIEQALLKTGSAVNDLGAAGTANEEKIVDFTNRVAGIAPSAGISIQNVLGLAATLDSLAQSTEVSGTTYANIIPDMFRNTGTYARVAGMDLKAFTELLNNDANEAFIRVLEGIKGNNNGMAEMTKRLDDLGVDGARSVSVLGALANNTQLLREQQDLSNQSFADGTSITNEYNTMNSTAQAELEKSQKKLHLFVVELGERLYPVMTAGNTLLGMFVGILSTLIKFLFEHGRALITLTTLVVAYSAALFIANAFSKEGIVLRTAEIALAKLKVFWDTAMTGSMHLLSAAYALTRGNIAAAKAEMIAFNTVTKLNPLGALVAILAAVTVAWVVYSDKLSAAAQAQKALGEVEADARKSIVEQRLEIERLLKVAQNKKASDDDRLAAIKRLNEISPEYLGNLNLENINTKAATEATEKYIDSLLKAARVKAAQDKLADLEKRRIDLDTKGTGAELTIGQKVYTSALAGLGFVGKAAQATASGISKNFQDARLALDAEQDKLEKYINSNSDQSPVKKVKAVVTGGGGNYETDKERKEREKQEREAKAAAERQRKEEIAAENKAYQERLKAADLFGRSRASMTTEELQRLALLEQEHQDKIQSINDKANKVSMDRASSALAELEKRQLAEQKYRQSLINPMNELIEQEDAANEQRLQKAGLFGVRKADLEAQLLAATKANNEKEIASVKDKIRAIEILEGIHQAKLNQIDAKTMKDSIDTKQRTFETELADLRIKNNVELSEVKTLADAKALLQESMSPRELDNIRTLADAKKALQKKNQDEETEFTRKHLEHLLRILQDTMASGEMDGLNLSDKILSDEEKEALEKKILEVKNLLAGLKNPTGTGEEDLRQSSLEKVDILGFTASDWDQMFENLENGKIGVDDLAMAAHGLINAWQMYNQFVEAGERKQLQEFEANTNKKKQALKKQLDSGQISQEKYNEELEKLDSELEKKRSEFEYKAAKRDKAVALMNAIVSTAASVARVAWNPVLAAIVGAIGAAQIAIIAKQPLPEVEGKEDGGPFIDVRRSQDGKKFRAKNDPSKRGFVSAPTIIAGESGREFVVNDAGVSNPSIAPVLSAIDTAQRNGTISTLNLERIMADRDRSYSRLPGRASGGSFNDTQRPAAAAPAATVTDPALMKVLQRNNDVINRLEQRISAGIKAEVALLGQDGFIAKQKELTDLQNQTTL